MNFFLENAAPIWVAGALALTMALIVYSSLRTTASLAAVVIVVLMTAGGLAVEHFWLTPAEQVQAELRGLLVDIEADDLPAVLARLAPAATEIAADAGALMPMFEVEKARATGAIEVTFPSVGDTSIANAQARIFVQARHTRSAMQGGTFSDVTFTFERTGDRWRLAGYSVGEEWRKKAAQLRR